MRGWRKGVTARKKMTSRDPESDFRILLAEGCAVLGIRLDQIAMDRLVLYFEELKRWSRKINLIAKESTDARIIENHFLDSLTLLPHLESGGRVHLLDVGSGAGFPGLACKAARPDIALTVVEPRLKRVSFLKHIVRTLKMNDVSVLACRIEDERLLPSETSFTHITGRAVTDLAAFLAMVSRFVRRDVAIICMKGPKWQEELEAAADRIEAESLNLISAQQIVLPFSGAGRCLLVLKILAKSG